MTQSNLRVYLVDDDPDIRSSLSLALSKRGYLVETYASAGAFLDTYDTSQHGCLLLDYGMPDMNGLELQKHLAKTARSLPIIFITGHGGIAESVTAMKAGAVDFLEKPFRQQNLIDSIEEAFSKTVEMQKTMQQTKVHSDNFTSLTNREMEIAQFIVTNSAMTSSKEIGRQLAISPRTVDHHRARILDKMQCKSVAELVDICLRMNLLTPNA